MQMQKIHLRIKKDITDKMENVEVKDNILKKESILGGRFLFYDNL